MRLAQEIETRVVQPPTERRPPQSELLVAGKPTGKRVSGAVLEAAVEVGGRFLLFLTDDVPHEDMLSVSLLDSRFEVLDRATIGAPYSTGAFSLTELREPNRIAFRFIGATEWSVEVLPRPAIRVPFLPDAPGVHRGMSFTRHFILRGDPQPETASRTL